MSQKKFCPECRQVLVKNGFDCICGWKDSKTNVETNKDRRCEYVLGERRCPLPGSICHTSRGNGSWYCGGHWRSLIDPKIGESILIDAENNYQQFLEDHKDWRIKLWDNK